MWLSITFVLAKFLSSLIYGIEPTDPLTLTGVSAVLIAGSLLAISLPARQAIKIDPATALRED